MGATPLEQEIPWAQPEKPGKIIFDGYILGKCAVAFQW
jgi:hypothetical protein